MNLKRLFFNTLVIISITNQITNVAISARHCFHGISSCTCSEHNKLTKVETITHGAPVQSVAWLSKFSCLDQQYIQDRPIVAIGGYQSFFDTCSYGVSVRIYKLNIDNDHLTEIATANPTPYVYSVDWCCIDGIPYLAVAGKTNLQESADVWIYRYETISESLQLVASAKHGATIYSVAWLCDTCSKNGKRFLAIGGQESHDKIDIRLLQFNPNACTEDILQIVTNRSHGATVQFGLVCTTI